MQLTEILTNYEVLADEIIGLLQEERGRLKVDPSEVNESLLERKRGLIDRLTRHLADLRNYQQANANIPAFASEQIQLCQQKFMKILQLDREVEKLFLAGAMRPKVPEMVPSAAVVGNAYRSASR